MVLGKTLLSGRMWSGSSFGGGCWVPLALLSPCVSLLQQDFPSHSSSPDPAGMEHPCGGWAEPHSPRDGPGVLAWRAAPVPALPVFGADVCISGRSFLAGSVLAAVPLQGAHGCCPWLCPLRGQCAALPPLGMGRCRWAAQESGCCLLPFPEGREPQGMGPAGARSLGELYL